MNDWKQLTEAVRDLLEAALDVPLDLDDWIAAADGVLEHGAEPIRPECRRDLTVAGVPIRLQVTFTRLEARDFTHLSVGTRDGSPLPAAIADRARQAFEAENGDRRSQEGRSHAPPGTVRHFIIVTPDAPLPF
jgi:hypothetical protein